MDSLKTSPMLEQYRRIKREQKGNILFFRLGDFYEMFAEDAIEVSSLLNLTLTSRNGLPMCGVPYHAARTYIARLLKLGKKIAICEQLTAPGKNKVIERDVVEIITPGTTVDEDFLDKGSSNYLASLALAYDNNDKTAKLSFSYIDLSTGDFYGTSFDKTDVETLRQELERLQIKEIIIQESLLENEIQKAVLERSGIVINRWADWLFDPAGALERLKKQFNLANLKGLGLQDDSAEIVSAGALLDYLDTTSKSLLPHIRTLNVYHDNEYMGIDESSQRNLELLHNQRDGDVRFSLLEIMDETKCAMGKRLLKRRILHPLRDLKKINSRLDLVEDFYRDQTRLSKIRELIGRTPDLERLCSRLAMDKAHGRDMLAVKNALVCFHAVNELAPKYILSAVKAADKNSIGSIKTPPISHSYENKLENTEVLQDVQILLEKSIAIDPSVLLNEGNLIKQGYSTELDNYKKLQNNARNILDDYLEEEREATGIANLKIRYNRLIGYYFEVTKAQLNRVPKHFIRRQGIAGGERYSTDRLANLESDINGAESKVIELERKLFLEVREEAKKALPSLASAARRIAEIDVVQSLAKAASVRNWTRPDMENSGILEIIDGRHPVVEAHLARGEYIPNNIILNSGINERDAGISFALITGPNMAGKSTYLRSAALIAIMSQTGSFVPVKEARIGICDRIYCRVGASDNLARGESTFLVEMNETAFILNTATDKSLVIMDEVGRGTATNDGLSIAWAVSEELLNRIRCRTLFATHFHELSLLNHKRLANRSMEVLEKGEKIIFLRKLIEGSTAESYGIHVAKLAGLNDSVINRANEIMNLLKERDKDLTVTFQKTKTSNENNYTKDGGKAVNHSKPKVNEEGNEQFSLFD